MITRGELTFCDAEGASISESLRQKDSCGTQLWRVFTGSKPPKKQV